MTNPLDPEQNPFRTSSMTLPVGAFHPSRVHYLPEGNEVTDPIPAWTRDAEESKLFAAVPVTDAMAPLYPVGEYVIFRREIHKDEPFDHVVYCSVAWRIKPAPRRPWEFWRPSEEVLARTGWQFCTCMRWYRKKKNQIVLEPLAPGFGTFVLGEHKGVETKADILGIATARKPKSHHVSGVSA